MISENHNPKIDQEKQTVFCMIMLYCRHHHCTKKQLCDECADLHQYAIRRLTLCRFGADKPTCERCVKHCYRKDYQQRIKGIMRYSGPRMLIFHPIMAIRHLLNNRKNQTR